MPDEEAPATAVSLFIAWAAAALAYFAVGFAFQFGGVAQVSPNPNLRDLYWEWYPLDQSVDFEMARLWGVVALRGWALTGEAATPVALALFLSHLALAGAAAMIPVSVLPAHSRGGIAAAIGLAMGALVYPLPGNWLWGGGWLANLGISLGLGHGLVDFGGAGVIFLSGSLMALAALIWLRPLRSPSPLPSPVEELVLAGGSEYHLTVYDEETDAPEEPVLPVTPMPSAYLPILSVAGAGLVVLSWLGLAPGLQSPTALNFSPAQTATGGLLAALSAALAAAGYSWFTTGRVNALMLARAAVAGLIVTAAGAPFMPLWLALLAGLTIGLLLPPLIYLFNQGLRLADETGAVATFGLSAVFSLLLVGLLADGRAGQGWNGVGLTEFQGVAGQGVSGLVVAPGFTPDWPGQLQAQLVGLGSIAFWSLLVGFLLCQTIAAIAKSWTRSGLELAEPGEKRPQGGKEMGPTGYIEIEKQSIEEVRQADSG
jgi:Amt family ammonium transporter